MVFPLNRYAIPNNKVSFKSSVLEVKFSDKIEIMKSEPPHD